MGVGLLHTHISSLLVITAIQIPRNLVQFLTHMILHMHLIQKPPSNKIPICTIVKQLAGKYSILSSTKWNQENNALLL